MPWNGTTLYLADARRRRHAGASPQVIAGGAAELIFQPEWSPDGERIVFVSDRSGWWNLYALSISRGARRARCSPWRRSSAQPQWVFGMSTYAFAGPDRIVCTYSQAGLGAPGDASISTTGTLHADRDAVHRYRRGARRRRHRGVSRRRAALPASVVALDLRDRPAPRPQAVDRHPRQRRSAHRRLSDDGRSRWNFRPRAARPRSACSIRRTIPTTRRPRARSRRCWSSAMAARPRGVEHAHPAQPVLDQPRHRGARRELRRQHRLRPRLSRAAATATGASSTSTTASTA